MGFEIKGLKEAQAKLKRMEMLNGLTLGELLPPEFISASSKFSSVQELFDASGYTFNSLEDVKAMPVDKWDEFIAENTTYPSWQQLLSAASARWIDAT